MSHACTLILVGVVFPVSEIKLPFKTAKLPFLAMDYSPWSAKKLIDRNWFKKFMQVGIDVTCMYTNFGGRGLSGFEDKITFQKQPNFPFLPWSAKNLIDRNRLKTFMQVGIDVICMHTKFGGCGVSGFGDKISL